MKFKSLALATVLALSTLTYSRPSNAMIGALMGNPALAIAGASIGVGSFFAMNATDGEVGIIGLLLGFVILDGENGQTLEFKELSQKSAKSLKVSEEERQSYNAEIDQVRFVASEVSAELGQMKKPKLKDSQKLWSELGQNLAPETLSAVQKISRQLVK